MRGTVAQSGQPIHMFTGRNPDRVKRIVRVILATALFACLLLSAFPLETLASGDMCALACCAGRAPHAAGSCMDGSCHAALRKRSNHNHSSPRKHVTEQLCGLTRIVQRLSSRTRRQTVDRSAENNQSQQLRFSSSTITKPCLPDCRSAASGSASSDFRNHAVITRREQSRPPVGPTQGRASFVQLLTLKTLIRQSAPRAPPITLS